MPPHHKSRFRWLHLGIIPKISKNNNYTHILQNTEEGNTQFIPKSLLSWHKNTGNALKEKINSENITYEYIYRNSKIIYKNSIQKHKKMIVYHDQEWLICKMHCPFNIRNILIKSLICIHKSIKQCEEKI